MGSCLGCNKCYIPARSFLNTLLKLIKQVRENKTEKGLECSQVLFLKGKTSTNMDRSTFLLDQNSSIKKNIVSSFVFNYLLNFSLDFLERVG